MSAFCIYDYSSMFQGRRNTSFHYYSGTKSKSNLASGINSRITVDFTSTHDWKASTDASWAVITPTSGKAGTASIEFWLRKKTEREKYAQDF